MAALHIEEFSTDVARILLHLYQHFPRPCLIEVSDICGIDLPDEYGVHSARHQACFGTLLWLADEGWLRFSQAIRQEGLDQVVLTSKALHCLARPLNLPDDSLCPATELQELLQSASSTRVCAAVFGLLFADFPERAAY